MPSVELILRGRRYLAFYLLCGLGGLAGYLLLRRLRFLDVTRDTPLVGASACIFGVLMAAAHLSPNRIIRLLWPSVEMRFKTLAWILIGLAILVIAARGSNAGGQAAHIRWRGGGLRAHSQYALVFCSGFRAQAPKILGPRRSRFEFLPGRGQTTSAPVLIYQTKKADGFSPSAVKSS